MENHRAVARRITGTLFAAQCFGSVAFLAVATVNSIAGVKLAANPAWGGVPSAIYQLGAALAALEWGGGMGRGRRRGGAAPRAARRGGGTLAAGALLLFLVSMICMGMATSALNLARFAAAEVTLPEERGRAIS